MGAVVRAFTRLHEHVEEEDAASVISQTADVRLSGDDYTRMKALCPHDSDIDLTVWTAFLARLLNRPTLNERQAGQLIAEYNTRLQAEYGSK